MSRRAALQSIGSEIRYLLTTNRDPRFPMEAPVEEIGALESTEDAERLCAEFLLDRIAMPALRTDRRRRF